MEARRKPADRSKGVIMTKRKRGFLLLGCALAGTPLITTATCDPYSGAFDFFRDDDYGDHNFFDDVLNGFDDWGWDSHHGGCFLCF